jgi:hypothetical protein
MLDAFSDGVWVESEPVSFLGLRLTATMTVLRLTHGCLLVHSPLPLTAERRAEVCALGRVAELYAPNTFHHRWLGDWITAFPEARVHAPEELATKRPDLKIDRFHDREPTPFDGVDEIVVRGFRLRETVLVHRGVTEWRGPSEERAARAAECVSTMIVADLVHNIGRPDHTWTKAYTKAMGFYDRVALSRVLRWTSFDDRAAARRSVDELLERAFDGLIVGHGKPVAHHARETLASAMTFLPNVALEPRE